jgi:hypothetical protein
MQNLHRALSSPIEDLYVEFAPKENEKHYLVRYLMFFFDLLWNTSFLDYYFSVPDLNENALIYGRDLDNIAEYITRKLAIPIVLALGTKELSRSEYLEYISCFDLDSICEKVKNDFILEENDSMFIFLRDFFEMKRNEIGNVADFIREKKSVHIFSILFPLLNINEFEEILNIHCDSGVFETGFDFKYSFEFEFEFESFLPHVLTHACNQRNAECIEVFLKTFFSFHDDEWYDIVQYNEDPEKMIVFLKALRMYKTDAIIVNSFSRYVTKENIGVFLKAGISTKSILEWALSKGNNSMKRFLEEDV